MPNLTLASEPLVVHLDPARGWALDTLKLGTHMLQGRAGAFPSFDILLPEGQRRVLVPDAPEIAATLIKEGKRTARVRYEAKGLFTCEVTWEVSAKEVQVSCSLMHESGAKLVALTDEGGLFVFNQSDDDPAFSGLVVPEYSGRVINFASKPEGVWEHQVEAHLLKCNFIAPSFTDAALILRPDHHAAKFTYGAEKSETDVTVRCGIRQYFRPSLVENFETPLCHEERSMRWVLVGDADGNDAIDWRDVGLQYRDMYIPPNDNLHTALRDGFSGGANMQCGEFLGYAEFLPLIARLDYAPQAWWMVSAQAPRPVNLDHLYWDFLPEWTVGDYFALKRAAEGYGAAIFVHQNWDVVTECRGWDESKIRRRPDGSLWQEGGWGGRLSYWRSFIACEKSGDFYRWIDDTLERWDIRPGDLWHEDVFDWFWREDYNTANPATLDTDYQVRRRLLEYCRERGVHQTTECLMEGISDLNDYAHWTFLYETGVNDAIPMLPLLFGGRTYYAYTANEALPDRDPRLPPVNYAYALLMGAKFGWSLIKTEHDALSEVYFRNNVLWSKICDAAATRIQQTSETAWRVDYDNGVTLLTDPETNEIEMTVDGITYAQHSPLNVRGFMGVWAMGDFDVPVADAAPYAFHRGESTLGQPVLTTRLTPGTTRLSGTNVPAAATGGWLDFCRAPLGRPEEPLPTGSTIVARRIPCRIECDAEIEMTQQPSLSGEFLFEAYSSAGAMARLEFERPGWRLRIVNEENAPAEWHTSLDLRIEAGETVLFSFHPYAGTEARESASLD